MSIIHSEEFIKAVSHFVEMCMVDVQWKTDYSNSQGVMAAGNLVDCIDKHLDNQVVFYEKRAGVLEKCLQSVISAAYNIDLPEGGLGGYAYLIEAADNADIILNKKELK